MPQSDLGLKLSTQKTRKREFLKQVQQVVPWKDWGAIDGAMVLNGPGRLLRRIHYLQAHAQRPSHERRAAQRATPLSRDFACLPCDSATTDESHNLRLRH